MNLSTLTAEQLHWLNKQAGDAARHWTMIIERMEAAGWSKADPGYTMACSILDDAKRLAGATHDALNEYHRDTLHEFSKKRTTGQIYRTQRRNAWERGEGRSLQPPFNNGSLY